MKPRYHREDVTCLMLVVGIIGMEIGFVIYLLLLFADLGTRSRVY